MAFVKLDCGMLDSTIWVDREAREIFITALLMCEPLELTTPKAQLEVRSLKETGFVVPPGWYGFVPAAGIGIVRRAGIETEAGLSALERLGNPEHDSRTPDFEGRRLVRVDGGFIALNFDKYRLKDHTAAARAARYRARKLKKSQEQEGDHDVSNVASRVTSRGVTQAEAEAEADINPPIVPQKGDMQLRIEKMFNRRPETHLTDAEKRAFKKSKDAIISTSEEDWLVLEEFYKAPQNETYARKDLATLVNNWNGEIDRALLWKKQKGSNGTAGKHTNQRNFGFPASQAESSRSIAAHIRSKAENATH